MKKTVALLGILLVPFAIGIAWADSTISNLTPGGTIQTQDYLPVARPSSPGQNFKVTIGSAGTQSIGTSGATVPLLNGVNTWSAQQSFLSGDLIAADPDFIGASLALPSGSTAQRPASPVNGMLRYNSDTSGIEGYVNGAWGPIGGSGISALTGDVTASGSGSVAATLATVNSNVGTFQGLTINAKGLVTGATNQNYAPLASPSFTTPNIGVASGASLALSGVASVGANSGTNGKLTLNGSTSGSVALQVPAVAGTGTVFQLPASNGTNGYVLSTNGSGVTSWAASSGGYSIAIGAGLTTTAGTQNATPISSSAPNLFLQAWPDTYTSSSTVSAADAGGLSICNSSSAITLTLPSVGTTGFVEGTPFNFLNENTGTCTVASSSTLSGAPTYALPQYASLSCSPDSSKWNCIAAATSGAQLTAANSWSAGQSGAQSTPSISTSTFTPDLNAANSFDVVLVHASCPCTIANPNNISSRVGQTGVLEIDQSSTGSDTIGTWGSYYKFSGGTAPTLSTSASAQDYFSYYVRDSTHIVISGGVLNAH